MKLTRLMKGTTGRINVKIRVFAAVFLATPDTPDYDGLYSGEVKHGAGKRSGDSRGIDKTV